MGAAAGRGTAGRPRCHRRESERVRRGWAKASGVRTEGRHPCPAAVLGEERRGSASGGARGGSA